jgi:hypothetical protein
MVKENQPVHIGGMTYTEPASFAVAIAAGILFRLLIKVVSYAAAKM